ncbi:hypothetical protein [Tepidimicrobium xylanilyticum]|uniref:Lipoprotein n=1 Tax=Tepidimicrobium xylanilyticum TaxID=1123352 RepID=A0A1H3ARD3_9FIRM|nr:hypothetical protein [Tepidimicrobium xylanilyticum]SDX32237.1 hypothetical protein SAMN05660923_02113 [Tepidimicrobium xylanilyticum]
MKKGSIITLFLIFAIMLTGCTNNELAFIKAFNKTQEINSAESKSVFKFTLKGEGFSPEDEQIVQQVTSLLNNTEVSITQKIKQNDDKTSAKAYADMKLNFGGMEMPMSVWVDVDMAGDKPKLIEIIKMPPMLMAGMSPEAMDKEYIVYDIDKLIAKDGEKVNYSKLIKFSKDMQSKLDNFFKDYLKTFKPKVEVVKYRGERTIDGNKLSIYELKLDDKSFKDFMRYTINYSLENKEVLKFMKGYMDVVMSMVENSSEENELMQEQIDMELDNLERRLPEIKGKFNEFMDKIDDISIIGDKGIVIEYGVNNDGYIVYEAGNIDFRIDLGAIGNVSKANTDSVKGVLNIGVEFNSKIFNINENITIDMPKVDENNSIYFNDMIDKSVENIVVEPVAN